MFRGRHSAVLGLVWMLAVGTAEAREVELSIDSRVGGDSNVLRSGFRKVEDAFFELSPRLTLRESQRDLNYNIKYIPTYTAFATTANLDGIDHLITGVGSWDVTPRDRLTASLRHSNRRRLRYDDSSPGPELLILEPSDQNRLRRTFAQARYSRQISSDWSGYFSASVDDYDPAPNVRGSEPDTRSYTGSLGGNHAFDSKTSGGLSVSGRFRDTRVRSLAFRPSSQTLIWDFSVNLSRVISESMSVSVQVGPSFISTKFIPDEIFPSSSPASSPTYSQETSIFAAASFEKSWQKANLDVRYVRSEFRGQQSASSTISDDVNADFLYEFTRKSSIRLNAGWNQRKQIVQFQNQSDIETIQWRAVMSLTHRLTRQLSLIGQYAYRTQDVQDVDGDGDSRGVGDTHTGFLSLRYTFDPIIF